MLQVGELQVDMTNVSVVDIEKLHWGVINLAAHRSHPLISCLNASLRAVYSAKKALPLRHYRGRCSSCAHILPVEGWEFFRLSRAPSYPPPIV
jgi:hypothetical protein